MSRIIWQNILIPDFSAPATVLKDEVYQDQIENLRTIAKATQEIPIPDPKAFRSMSRASVFLSHVCMAAKDSLAPFLGESPFSIGMYCAVEHGPIDAPSTAKIILQKAPEHFAENYRKFRNPKMYLKQLPNLVPAQMAISMGLQGPMNVYTHSTVGSLHAIEQAEWDLKTGAVKAALVCSAHAFDDFLVVKRARHFDNREIAEGAGAMLLVSDGTFTNWKDKITKDNSVSFGISDQVINLLRRETNV